MDHEFTHRKLTKFLKKIYQLGVKKERQIEKYATDSTFSGNRFPPILSQNSMIGNRAKQGKGKGKTGSSDPGS